MKDLLLEGHEQEIFFKGLPLTVKKDDSFDGYEMPES